MYLLCSSSIVPVSYTASNCFRQPLQAYGILLIVIFPIPSSRSTLKLYIVDIHISLPLFLTVTFLKISHHHIILILYILTSFFKLLSPSRFFNTYYKPLFHYLYHYIHITSYTRLKNCNEHY